MKITYLGQAGLLFETEHAKVMIDPYLSDSVGKINPSKKRRLPIDESFFEIQPDVMIFTHDHLDHYDPESAHRFLLKDKKMTVLSPESVYLKARELGGAHNYVLFDRGTEWSEFGLLFKSVKAEHSDKRAIGVIIDDGNKKYYVTGDTLYNEGNFADIKEKPDVVFLPINGEGNNMNMTDAKRFCERIGARIAVPLHTGLFDSLDPNDFAFENKVIPEIYKEIKL